MAACMPSMGLEPLQLGCMADPWVPKRIRSDCARFLDSEAETTLAMLGWMQGWDVVGGPSLLRRLPVGQIRAQVTATAPIERSAEVLATLRLDVPFASITCRLCLRP